MVKEEFLISTKESPDVILADNLGRRYENNGVCAYYGNNPRPCTIILNPESQNLSEVLIHECIRTSLRF